MPHSRSNGAYNQCIRRLGNRKRLSPHAASTVPNQTPDHLDSRRRPGPPVVHGLPGRPVPRDPHSRYHLQRDSTRPRESHQFDGSRPGHFGLRGSRALRHSRCCWPSRIWRGWAMPHPTTAVRTAPGLALPADVFGPAQDGSDTPARPGEISPFRNREAVAPGPGLHERHAGRGAAGPRTGSTTEHAAVDE